MKNKTTSNVLFLSMTNRAGGAEQVFSMLSEASKSPMFFIKRVHQHVLPIKDDQQVEYITDGPLWLGFLKLIPKLYKYRKDHTIVSSSGYLNAFLGMLKRVGYLKSTVIARESHSLFVRFSGFKKWSYQFVYKLGYPAINMVI